MPKPKPTPGSDKAVKRGCTCSPVDNCNGDGAFGSEGELAYWYSLDCPIHREEVAAING